MSMTKSKRKPAKNIAVERAVSGTSCASTSNFSVTIYNKAAQPKLSATSNLDSSGYSAQKQHVAIIALCRGHVLANLLFASATEFQDVELHSLAFSLVRFHAITIEQLQDARPTAHWESRLNSCSNLVA
jgi:hypothetical protein